MFKSKISCLLTLFYFLNYYPCYSQKIIFDKAIGEENKDEYLFRNLSGINTINHDLAVFDNHKIFIIDSLGKLKCKFGGLTGSKDNTGLGSNTIVSDEFGNYIVNAGQFKGEGIKLFSPKGEFKRIILDGGKIFVENEGVFSPNKIVRYNKMFYLLDITNNNIKKFNNNWDFIGTIGKPNNFKMNSTKSLETRVSESKKEDLINPCDFLLDSKGNIYIVDYGNIIKKYDNNGKYLKSFTFSSKSYPCPSISIDKDDNIFVLIDGVLNVISKNDVILDKYKNVLSKKTKYPNDNISSITIDEKYIYVAYNVNNIIAVLSKDNFQLLRIISNKINDNTVILKKPQSIVINKQGDLIIREEGKDRYELIKNPNYSEISTTNFRIKGTGLYDYTNPICVNQNGNTFMVDIKNKKILIFDETGEFLNDLQTSNVLNEPTKVICRDSTIIVIDKLPNKYSQIIVFNKNGQFIKRIDKNKSNQDFITYHVDKDLNGNIYFSEGGSINVIAPNGKFINEIGGYGKVIRSDLNIGIVQDKDKIILKIGNFDSEKIYLDGIVKFQIYKNKIFIADMHKIVVTDLKGNIVGYFGGKHGHKIGEFDDIYDFDIYNGKIFICDYNNNRIVVCKISI